VIGSDGDAPRYPDFDGSQTCATTDPEAYFPVKSDGEPLERAADARRLCQHCHFLDECGEWAIHHLVKGIWGGMTEAQRKKIRHKRRIKGISLDAARLHEESMARQREQRKQRREDQKETIA
jgi:WhiB family redox-sensing transcriptional regulator